jgi:hypothetical protein
MNEQLTAADGCLPIAPTLFDSPAAMASCGGAGARRRSCGSTSVDP